MSNKPILSIPSLGRDNGELSPLAADLKSALNGAYNLNIATGARDLKELVGGHITASDSMLFMGDPLTKDSIGDMALLYLILDAIQSGMPMGMQWADNYQMKINGDGLAYAKPVVMLDSDGHYQLFIDRVMELKQHGLLKPEKADLIYRPDNTGILKLATKPREVVELLHAPPIMIKPFEAKDDDAMQHIRKDGLQRPDPLRLQTFVCCSFSTTNPYFLDMAELTGAELAKAGFDLITGGGRGGMMLRTQKGAYENGAFVTGITFAQLNPIARFNNHHSPGHYIHQIIGADGMPHRIQKMARQGNIILLLPGGFGTDTELFAPLFLKAIGHHSMENTMIAVVDTENPLLSNQHNNTILLKMLERSGLKEGVDFERIAIDLTTKRESTQDTSANQAAVQVARALEQIRRQSFGIVTR
ncbi:MAG: hypothetical protein EB060_04715 [Proteobacteria bacterium]|nr:hypothetical protein [Pseudomonadota bacterium]